MLDVSHISDIDAFLDELRRRDFTSFLIRAFPHINGGSDLSPNWHIDAIAYQLGRIRDGTCTRLLVTMPPRNLKSITISVAWVAWCLGHDPRLNFVCVSYSNELAAKLARDCRTIIQADWYRKLFPRTIVSAARSATHDFQTTAGGGRLATSITGTLTGRGGDIIIIDDPIKPDEALSEATRDAVNDWYRSTLGSRLNDKARGAIITVMQRLHQFDLAGTLIESGEWDHLNLPAIATKDSVIPLTRGRRHHRKSGEILHPARESLDTLRSIERSMGSVLFSAQYQQEPVPADGNMVRAAWLRIYQPPVAAATEDRIVQSWDTASKDGIHNAWSVCITARVRRNITWILDIWRERVTFPDLKRAATALARDHTADVLLIEDQSSGQQLIQTLLDESPRGVPAPTKRKPDTDKITRLAGVSAMIEAGQLILPAEAPWLGTFKHELLAFPSTRYMDQVDALSQLLIWVREQQRLDLIQPIGASYCYFNGKPSQTS